MTRSALVIGGTGFLGTGIVEELLLAGWSVTSLGRGRIPNRATQAAFIQCDRNTPGALAAAVADGRFDLVVDCAAYKAPEAQSVIESLATRTGHYVLISTDFVYAAPPDLRYPLSEDAPKQTEAPYGGGKLACEAALAAAWKDRQFPSTSLRPPHILGHGKVLGADFSQMRDPQVLDRIRSGNGLTLIADGQLLIQPVWHREIGRCIAHIAGNPAAFGQIFNIAGPDCVTTLEYYQIIARRLNVELRFRSLSLAEVAATMPDRAPVLRHRIYDTTRLRTTTGYVPSLRLDDAIAETLAWMQAAQPG